MAISVASALVSSRLDHVNSMLYGAASKHTNRLQHIQKALARTVMHQRSHGSPLSSTALLQNLHWPPIEWRIRFKLATLAYKALHTGQPPYLAELLRRNEPVHSYKLCDLPLRFCSLFHDAILSLARVLSESLHQRFGTHSMPIIAILHHSLLFVGISKHTIFS